jgi:hypothetical protein
MMITAVMDAGTAVRAEIGAPGVRGFMEVQVSTVTSGDVN